MSSLSTSLFRKIFIIFLLFYELKFRFLRLTFTILPKTLFLTEAVFPSREPCQSPLLQIKSSRRKMHAAETLNYNAMKRD